MKVMNGMRGNGQVIPDFEVLSAIRARGLAYPIPNKAEFVAAMSNAATPVAFRGRSYGAAFGASLVPDFFFPVWSEQDLLGKLSELLMARGLAPMVVQGSRAGDGRDVPEATSPMSSSRQAISAGIVRVLDDIGSNLCRPLRNGRLDRETVEALDVITHALVFVEHPLGLDVWRDALRTRQFSADAHQAVARMLDYLTDAMARGRTDEVSRICDCLHAVLRAAVSNVSAGESHDAR